MAVADDRQAGCEGCGRTVPLEKLTAVTMPNGEQVACCPRCEPHAREAARKCSSLDQRRDACDGCTRTVLESRLEEFVLEDGTVVSCCPSCVADAPGSDADSPSSNSGTGPESKSGSRSEANATDGSTAEAATDADGASSGERNVCPQCNEWVNAELFRVTTVDDRTERHCPSCKEAAERKGIVKDVAIRKTKAREVLGVEPGASDERLREAYHEQVKRAHPDRKSGSKTAFQLVKDAYDRLREASE